MPELRQPVTSDFAKDLVVRSLSATIVDVPTVRKHKLASLSVVTQSCVIVQAQLANGVLTLLVPVTRRPPANARSLRGGDISPARGLLQWSRS